MRRLPNKCNVSFEAVISRSENESTGDIQNQSRVGNVQASEVDYEGGTYSVKLERDHLHDDEGDIDDPGLDLSANMDELEMNDNVWDITEPRQIYDMFLFNEEEHEK